MWGWLGRIGEVVKDWWDRLTGRGREEDEEDEEEEEEDEEEEEEDEEEEEEDEEEEEEGEEEEQDDDEEADEVEVEVEVDEEAGEVQDEETDDDDYTTLLDLVREIENDLDENADYLTNEELARTDELLEQLYELLAEYDSLDADDRAALIDLALELLDELERLILSAVVDRENEDACPDRRGPFATRQEAKAYADEIPLPTWVYQDGLGWWWVCIEYTYHTHA